MPPKRGRHIAQETAQTAQQVSATATLAAATHSVLTTTTTTTSTTATMVSHETIAMPSPPAFAVPAALRSILAARGRTAAVADETQPQHTPMVSEQPHEHQAKADRVRTSAKTVPSERKRPRNEAEPELDSVAAASTQAHETAAKPLIRSHRWRGRLATVNPAAEAGQGAPPAPVRTWALDRDEAKTSSRGGGGDNLFFSNSADDVIHFGSRPHDAVELPSSSDDDSGSWSDNSSENGELDQQTEEGTERTETAQERRRRQQREARHRRMFDHHVQDYEESALQAHEAALLHDAEHDDGDESDDEEEEAYSLESDVVDEEAVTPTTTTPGTDVHAILRQRSDRAGPQRFGTLFFASHLDEAALAASLSKTHHKRTRHDDEDDDEDDEADMSGLPCYLTLLGVNDPITIQGPCGVVGLGMGEASVGGYYMGNKQLGLWNPMQRAVVTPVTRLKGKGADREEAPRWGHGRAYRLATSSTTPGEEEVQDNSEEGITTGCLTPVDVCRWEQDAAADAAAGAPSHTTTTRDDAIIDMDLSDVEGLFGVIDWQWVEDELARWKTYFSTRRLPLAVLLIVRPYEPGRSFVRRHYLRHRPGAKGAGNGATTTNAASDAGFLDKAASMEQAYYGTNGRDDAFVEIPSFVAKCAAQSVDAALLPEVIPAVVQRGSGSVVVIGSANIGKTTLCRFLVNGFLSQHGLCYWLDMDLGQPEFGVPGQLALYCVRQPLFRDGDERDCAELVQALFLGSSTVRCPVAVGNAIAAMSELVRRVQREHPVVVNTHGWVLHTGRRTTTELIQRVRPRHVVHLLKSKEEAWARDAAALMDPMNGLNAEVLSNRFLVRHCAPPRASASAPSAPARKIKTKQSGKNGKGSGRTDHGEGRLSSSSPQSEAKEVWRADSVVRLGRLPHPPIENSRNVTAGSQVSRDWDGDVHSVFVSRSLSAVQRQFIAKEKGSRGRQARWQQYFAPLLATYKHEEEEEEAVGAGDGETEGSAGPFSSAAPRRSRPVVSRYSTRLAAPLSALRALVIAELDERVSRLPLQQVGAMLERAVVAVQLLCPVTSTRAGTTPTNTSLLTYDADGAPFVNVTSLTSLTDGFAVSCYGLVESTEEAWTTWQAEKDDEEKEGGSQSQAAQGPMVSLHVPLPPTVVEQLLARCAQAGGGLSIAYSPGLRDDTSFLEHYA